MNNLRIELPSGHRALRAGRQSLAGCVYLVTTTTLARSPCFLDFATAACVCRGFANRRLMGDAKLLAWVLMPDHAHWLIELGPRDTLDQVVARLKSATSRAANHERGIEGPLWSRAYHDRALRHWQEVRAAAKYIIANPVRGGLVRHLGDYPYWDTVWTGITQVDIQSRVFGAV